MDFVTEKSSLVDHGTMSREMALGEDPGLALTLAERMRRNRVTLLCCAAAALLVVLETLRRMCM